MKVLVAGYSKTGTKSLDSALETLGYKVFGYDKCYSELSKEWEAFFAGKGSSESVKRMYGGYDAASDMPAFCYWREFLEAFPNIKLVMTERDEASFIKSWNVMTERYDKSLSIPMNFSKTAHQEISFWEKCMKVMIPHPPPTSSFFKRSPHYENEVLIKSFRDHQRDVAENAPKDQLLRFNVRQGWEPLCRFLGKDVPDVPFPHMNKNGNLIDKYKHQINKEMFATISFWTVIIGLACSVMFFG